MSTRRLALPGLFALLALAAAARAAEPKLAEADRLYRAYEDLNTPANLALPFSGGAPPSFILSQADLLRTIAALPAKDAVPVLAKATDEYLARITALGAQRFRQSPLAPLQIPIIQALSAQAQAEPIRARLEALAKSPLIMEFARARVLGTLAEERIKAVPPDSDPDASRRRQILFDTLLAGQPLVKLLHAPARLNAFADRVIDLTGHNPLRAAKLLDPAADTPARRYAADYAITIALARKLNDGPLLDAKEMALFKDVAQRYAVTFLPEVQKEHYASRLLGDALVHLGTLEGNEAVAGLLRDYGLEPPPPPPEPAQPPTIVEEKENPNEPATRAAVAQLLADAADAAAKNQEADTQRLLAQLATPAALPALQAAALDPKAAPPTRAVALRALARNGSELAVYTLLSLARRPADTRQLEPVVFALTEVRSPAAIPALLEAVFDSTDARLGAACTQVIARLPQSEKANSLLRACRDQDFEAVPLLAALARDWKSERGPYAGIDGLAALGTPEAVKALFDLLGEKAFRDDAGRRVALQRALSEAIGSNADSPEVLAIAAHHLKAASPAVRLAAARSLAGIDDPAVRRSLAEAAETETDPEVARALKSLLREQPAKGPPPPPPPPAK